MYMEPMDRYTFKKFSTDLIVFQLLDSFFDSSFILLLTISTIKPCADFTLQNWYSITFNS